jgi:hypothetical protein
MIAKNILFYLLIFKFIIINIYIYFYKKNNKFIKNNGRFLYNGK